MPVGNCELVLRRAREEDARDLWRWRNDPLARAMSRETGEVPWERHLSWVEERIRDPGTLMLIGEFADRPIGVVRFQSGRPHEADISIALDPAVHGRGLGSALLRLGCRQALESGFCSAFNAAVRGHNLRSRQLFERCGFMLVSATGEWLHFRLVDPNALS